MAGALSVQAVHILAQNRRWSLAWNLGAVPFAAMRPGRRDSPLMALVRTVVTASCGALAMMQVRIRDNTAA